MSNSDIKIMDNIDVEDQISSQTSNAQSPLLNKSNTAEIMKNNDSIEKRVGLVNKMKDFCINNKIYLMIGAIVIGLLVYYFVFYKKNKNKNKDDVIISLPDNVDNNIPLPPKPIQHMEISKEQYDNMIDQSQSNMPQIVHPGQNLPINDDTDNADDITQSNDQQSLTAMELKNINDQLQQMQKATN